MKHTVEGCLVKYNTPWFNGTEIKPGAFDKYKVEKVPIFKAFHEWDSIIGSAILRYEEDGVYYEGEIFDSEDSDAEIQRCLDMGLDLGLLAIKVDKTENEVTSAKLMGMSFAHIPDGAAMITKIDGMKVVHKEDPT